MKGSIFVVLLCVTATFAVESFEDMSTRVALKVYEDCSASEDFYVCLKKKAITVLDRLGRAQKFSISDSVKLVRASDAPAPKEVLNEAKLDEILPRSIDAKNSALSEMIFEKISDFIGSRTIEISLPRTFPDDEDSEEEEEEARLGSGGGLGGKKGLKGKKKGSMMGGMMMMFAGKMMAMKAYFLAGLFLLAKKALIISKIALLISGIMALKKLMASKNGNQGGASVSHVYAGHGGGGGGGGGHDSGWSSGSGGGWDKRSADGHDLAYSAYVPK